MAQSTIKKRDSIRNEIYSISGIDSNNYQINSFCADRGITPTKVISVMPRFDSGLSTQPISIMYSSADDVLRIRVTNSPTNGALSIQVSYVL